MDKVEKTIGFQCYIPSSEPFRIHTFTCNSLCMCVKYLQHVFPIHNFVTQRKHLVSNDRPLKRMFEHKTAAFVSI